MAIRQKRQKLLKPNKSQNALDASYRSSGYSVDTGEKRLFGVSLAACMQNERRLDLENRCRSLDDSSCPNSSHSAAQCRLPQRAKTVKSEPEMIALSERKWLYPSTQNLYPDSTQSSPYSTTGSAPPTCSLPVKEFSLVALPAEAEKEVVTGRFVKKQRPSSASFSYSLDAQTTDDVDPHTLQVPRIVENCTQYLMAYGNRMDARNLATIFAPSILRPDHGKLHATLAENEQQIAIVETMIAHVEDVFRIPKELQCNIYNKLRDTDPDRLDRFLNHLSRTESGDHQPPSPFPATAEEAQQDCPSPGSHSNGKDSLSTKVCSQRSGSWPFSLGRSSGQQQFFPVDSACPSTSSCPSDDNDSKEASSSTTHNTDTVSKDLATTAPGEFELLTYREIDSKLRLDRARSPSRERDFRLTARLGAAAARRRFCNVVRAFRFSSVTRSSPNVADY
ncbi:hypothetical protein GCK32_006113 [Trichostrongylus colubriformis]|uniref:Rho-GAP domain-containing protein n=1 Tax=Trichostrongylus colubriformis TaxID=6319 RepID=A0AAN8FE82_TRICO